MTGPAPGDATKPGHRRSAARLNAVQALYQIEQTELAPEIAVEEFKQHRVGREIDGELYAEPDPALFQDLVLGTSARRDEIDRLIGGALQAPWTVKRLESILRAVLRAATYELLARPDIPARVVISEYVDVAHAFFAGTEPGFVNGVIDRLGREIRPGELKAGHGGPA